MRTFPSTLHFCVTQCHVSPLTKFVVSIQKCAALPGKSIIIKRDDNILMQVGFRQTERFPLDNLLPSYQHFTTKSSIQQQQHTCIIILAFK